MEIINLKDYTIIEHLLFATGCLLWVITYIVVIQSIRRRQFIEIPIIAVCANFTWEFLWSFVFVTDMGALYVWGYRIWFLLDCFILFGLFKYGANQLQLPILKRHFQKIILLGLVSWGFILFFYIKDYGYPAAKNGAYSGYILNVMMSALYIPLFLRIGRSGGMSLAGAWLKGVGTLLITGFCFLRYQEGFLLSMCAVTTVLDAIYIYAIQTSNYELENAV